MAYFRKGFCHWKEFCVSKWAEHDNKNSLKRYENSLKQLKTASFTCNSSRANIREGFVIGGIFASDNWGGDGGGLFSGGLMIIILLLLLFFFLGGGGKKMGGGGGLLPTPETSGRLRTSVRCQDIWDRLGNFRELHLVNSSIGNHGPIITHASYSNDPRNQIAER